MSFTTNNSVLYNVDQNFPESAGNGASKERARNNIGAASAAALTAETQRATDAEKAATSEVVAGSGISVTSSTGSDGQNIYTVTNTSVDTTYTAGYGIDITDSVVSWDYSVGRNLYLNTNKEIQTDIPGGKLHPTSVAWTEVGSLGAVYKVIARANGTGTYEVGLRYTGSGVSTTYTFIGKSFTTLDSSPSMSFSKIVNVAATLEYSTAFGPAFNPSSTESVTIEGTLILARIYDFRAVMYSDENGDVQVAFTAVEVGH